MHTYRRNYPTKYTDNEDPNSFWTLPWCHLINFLGFELLPWFAKILHLNFHRLKWSTLYDWMGALKLSQQFLKFFRMINKTDWYLLIVCIYWTIIIFKKNYLIMFSNYKVQSKHLLNADFVLIDIASIHYFVKICALMYKILSKNIGKWFCY